jgi:hypothetical protein
LFHLVQQTPLRSAADIEEDAYPFILYGTIRVHGYSSALQRL